MPLGAVQRPGEAERGYGKPALMGIARFRLCAGFWSRDAQACTVALVGWTDLFRPIRSWRAGILPFHVLWRLTAFVLDACETANTRYVSYIIVSRFDGGPRAKPSVAAVPRPRPSLP